MKRNPFSEHVEPFIKAGQLWRAKDYLQGSIGTSSYHRHLELYEAYGRVLLQMGDTVEAGKYLFLSGCREAEYDKAIELYLNRHGRNGWPQLYSSFPKRARLPRLEDYPEPVAEELRRLQSPTVLPKPMAVITQPSRFNTNGFLSMVFTILLVVFVLACLLVGFAVIFYSSITWLASQFF